MTDTSTEARELWALASAILNDAHPAWLLMSAGIIAQAIADTDRFALIRADLRALGKEMFTEGFSLTPAGAASDPVQALMKEREAIDRRIAKLQGTSSE